jgi:hypothetical protein
MTDARDARAELRQRLLEVFGIFESELEYGLQIPVTTTKLDTIMQLFDAYAARPPHTGSGDTDISLCDGCNCMTHTIHSVDDSYRCAKCKYWKREPDSQDVNRTAPTPDIGRKDVKYGGDTPDAELDNQTIPGNTTMATGRLNANGGIDFDDASPDAELDGILLTFAYTESPEGISDDELISDVRAKLRARERRLLAESLERLRNAPKRVMASDGELVVLMSAIDAELARIRQGEGEGAA